MRQKFESKLKIDPFKNLNKVGIDQIINDENIYSLFEKKINKLTHQNLLL